MQDMQAYLEKLAGVVIGCVKCKSSRSMAGAFQKDVLNRIFASGCPGERPWLGPAGVEECRNKIPQNDTAWCIKCIFREGRQFDFDPAVLRTDPADLGSPRYLGRNRIPPYG
jgi:hypothetical protein